MEGGAKARRRRLVERGSDRLAFITGQARSLPADSSPASPLSNDDTAAIELPKHQPSEGGLGGEFRNRDPFQRSEQSGEAPEVQPSDEVHKRESKDKTPSDEGDLLPKVRTSSEVPEIQPVNETLAGGHEEEILVQKTSDFASASVPPRRRETEAATRSVAPSQSNQLSAAWSMETLKEHLNFSPHQISQSISASENIRLLSSVVIAFLVVLSTCGYNIGGAVTRGIVSTRPLLFLMPTNLTIVFGLLMANKGTNKKENEKARAAGGNLGSSDSIGQMLELGLLLQNAVGALLMDCSIGAVIMICFLGF